jgi:uncharacterized protein (TIGR03435 family)
MTRPVLCLLAFTLGVFAAEPEFEVATIKPNKSGQTQGNEAILPSGQFQVTNVAMTNLVQFAYKVTDNFIFNKPSWFGSDRFDMVGKAGTDLSPEQLRPMLQTFLKQEFKLQVHEEQRPMDAFVMVVGKGGSKLVPAASKDKSNCKRVGGPVINGEQHMACTGMTIQELAEALPSIAPGYIRKPVVDQTGISGTYDFQLDWVGVNFIDQGGLTMPDAVLKALGIKMEEKKIPMTVIVIDHVEKIENQ